MERTTTLSSITLHPQTSPALHLQPLQLQMVSYSPVAYRLDLLIILTPLKAIGLFNTTKAPFVNRKILHFDCWSKWQTVEKS